MTKGEKIEKMYQVFRVYKDKYKSLSKRIRAMNGKIDNVISSHEYYIRRRFPMVVANENRKKELIKSYNSVIARLKRMLKHGPVYLQSKKKSGEKRYLIFLTRAEYQKLGNVLKKGKSGRPFNKKKRR